MTSGMSSRQLVEYDGQSVGIQVPTLDVGSWDVLHGASRGSNAPAFFGLLQHDTGDQCDRYPLRLLLSTRPSPESWSATDLHLEHRFFKEEEEESSDGSRSTRSGLMPNSWCLHPPV